MMKKIIKTVKEKLFNFYLKFTENENVVNLKESVYSVLEDRKIAQIISKIKTFINVNYKCLMVLFVSIIMFKKSPRRKNQIVIYGGTNV